MTATPTPWRVFRGADGHPNRYPGIESIAPEADSIVVFGDADEMCGVRGATPERALDNANLICDAVNAHEIALAAIAYVECQFQPFGKASCDVWIRLHEAVLAWRATGLSDGIAREIEAL